MIYSHLFNTLSNKKYKRSNISYNDKMICFIRYLLLFNHIQAIEKAIPAILSLFSFLLGETISAEAKGEGG